MDQYRCPTGSEGKAVAASMNRRHSALTAWGLEHVKINPDSIILDVGCGGGKTVSTLAQRAVQGKVFGIDYSRHMVEYSKEINRELITQNRVEIKEASVEKTGFPDSFFDLVTAIETHYFWPSLPDAFQEIKRVLKPEGKLLMVNEMVKDGVYEVENAEMIEKAHVRLFRLQEIQGMLEAAGFADVKVFTKAESPWNAVLAKKPKQ
jgi:cyclopropane fatty-acyl-phospholipid synthase-like methyltransferase